MAAVLRIQALKLLDATKHLATDWQISRTVSFNDIVCESIQDEDNLISITFPNVLNPNIKYYGRARALLDTGYTVWGNLHVFIPTAINDLDESIDLPSPVGIPIISTDSFANDHSATLFNINVSGYMVLGSADHLATTWIIEKLDGTPVWMSADDEVNRVSIFVNNIILENEKCYRIKAMFTTTSGDTSQISTKTIVVCAKSPVELCHYLDDADATTDTLLEINPCDNATGYTWEILIISESGINQIWTQTTTDTTTTIPANTLAVGSIYSIRIADNYTNSWKYYTFTTKQPM